MTRIHEALTKAVRERSAAQANDPAVFLDSVRLLEPQKDNPSPNSVDPQTTFEALTFGRTEPQSADLPKVFRSTEWSVDPTVDAFANPSSSAIAAEQFRMLRSRLFQLRTSQPMRTLLITSAVAGEGKSFVAFNLAQAIVRQPNQRTLLIDADLRSSRLHTMLGAPNALGLTDYLGGQADENTIVQSSPEGKLCFIPSGRKSSNPSELLANGSLRKLIQRLAPSFDWVIIDCPPCLPVTDANVAADACDAVLLVVKAYSTPTEIAQRAKQELEGRNVLGVVLNSVNQRLLSYGARYDYPQTEPDAG